MTEPAIHALEEKPEMKIFFKLWINYFNF